MPGLSDWFGQQIPGGVMQQANRAGWGAFLGSAANAQPGYLGQSLLGGLGPQQQARYGVLSQYVAEQQERQRQEQAAQYQQAIMAQMQAQQQRAAQEQQMEQQRMQAEAQQRQQIQQAAQAMLAQLPDGPERQQGAALAMMGDLGGLQKLLGQAQERQRQEAAYAPYGVSPDDPVAEELIKRKLGMGAGQQERSPYFQYTRRGAFNSRTGELSPFPGQPPEEDPALKRAQQEATDIVAREAAQLSRDSGGEQQMNPQQAAQRIQQLTAALYQSYSAQPPGLPGVDPAMAGARPQGGVGVTPGQAPPPPTVTPRGTAPNVSRGSTAPVTQRQTLVVRGQRVSWEQSVGQTRESLLARGEEQNKERLRMLGFDELTIEQLVAEARNR
jgi:hypothetical protein